MTAGLNLFVISTPFQLIGCSEAKAHYNLENCLLVINRPDNDLTVKQISYLLKKYGWSRKEVWWLPKPTFYFRLPFLFRFLAAQRISRLFIGNRGSWLHEIFYRGIDYEALTFLDDGLGATVRYYWEVQEGIFCSRVTPGKVWLLGLLGIRLGDMPQGRLHFFTCFPLADSEKVEIQTHNFPVFRQCFNTQSAKRKDGGRVVGYLGQHAGGQSLVNRLRGRLAEIAGIHRDCESIVYFMHRKERRNRLESHLQGLPVELRENQYPIEVEVALSGAEYCAFYSFTSTALFSLKMIFPELAVYQIQDPKIAGKIPYQEKITEVFDAAEIPTAPLAMDQH